jgi:hypothetical protein
LHACIGYIIVVLALRTGNDVVSGLVEHAIKYLFEKKVDAIYYTVVKGHLYERILSKHGFVDTRRRPYLYYRVYRSTDEVEKFLNASPARLNYQFEEYDSIW